MVYNQNNNEEYASKGTGTAALTTGIIGTVGTAISTGLLGNLFGGNQNNQNPSASPIYQLSQKDNEIALLKAQQYSDNKDLAIYDKISKIDSRLVALETAAPLREQIIMGGLSSLAEKVNGIVRYCVPNYALNPGYGPAMVGPMPPPGIVLQPVVQGSASSTPATATTAQAA